MDIEELTTNKLKQEFFLVKKEYLALKREMENRKFNTEEWD